MIRSRAGGFDRRRVHSFMFTIAWNATLIRTPLLAPR